MFRGLFKILNSIRVKNSLIYLTASVAGSGIAFFLVPILTRFLSPNDYGIVSNYLALLTLSSYFICLSNSGYIFRNYYFLNKEELSRSLSNVFFINFSGTLGIFTLLIILNKIVFSYLQIPLIWLLFIPLLGLGQIFIDTTLGFFQAQNQAKKYSLLQLGQTVLNLGFSILFVVAFLWDWQGRIIAQIITISILGMIGIFILYKKFGVTFSVHSVNKVDIKDFLKFGIPLIPHSVGGFVLALSDRFFLSSMVSVSATGLYSVGSTFGGLMMILHGAFYKVYMPYAFEKLSQSNDSISVKRKLVKITYIYISGFVALSLLLYFFAVLIFPWFVGPKFEKAYVYVLWISLGYAMLAAYQMFTIYAIYTKQTQAIALRTDFLAAAVKLPLTYFLILYIGPIGAAVATFIAYFITAISALHINNKIFPMPWFTLRNLEIESI